MDFVGIMLLVEAPSMKSLNRFSRSQRQTAKEVFFAGLNFTKCMFRGSSFSKPPFLYREWRSWWQTYTLFINFLTARDYVRPKVSVIYKKYGSRNRTVASFPLQSALSHQQSISAIMQRQENVDTRHTRVAEAPLPSPRDGIGHRWLLGVVAPRFEQYSHTTEFVNFIGLIACNDDNFYYFDSFLSICLINCNFEL